MNHDAAFISKLLNDGVVAHLAGIKAGYFYEVWADRYRWIEKFFKEHGTLPKRETFEGEFGEALPDTQEPISWHRSKIIERAKSYMLGELLKDGPLESLKAGNVDKAISDTKDVVVEIGREFVQTGNGASIELSDTAMSRWKAYQEREGIEGLLGLGTPWPTINEITNGFQDGDLVMVLAKSGVGKTFFVMKLADYVRKEEGKDVLVVSQEMHPRRLAIRIDAIGAAVSFSRFRAGKLNAEERKRYFKYIKMNTEAQKFGWGRLVLAGQADVKNVTDLEVLIDTHKPSLVIWDSYYIACKSRSWDDQGALVRDMKMLAESRSIPLIATTQFNRGVDDEANMADQNAAAWTSSVIQDADVVLGLFQNQKLREQRILKVRSIKIRDGMPIEDLDLNWNLETMVFNEKSSLVAGTLVFDSEESMESFHNLSEFTEPKPKPKPDKESDTSEGASTEK